MKQKVLTIFLVMMLAFAVRTSIAYAEAFVDSPSKGLLSGDKAFEEGKFTQAMKIYEELYVQGIFSEKMLYRLAYMHENLRAYPQAIYYLKKAAQEFGDRDTDPKIRQLMQRQGSTHFFTGDTWNGYLSFFRSWGWLFFTAFGISIAGLWAHYLLPTKGMQGWRQMVAVGAWAVFLSVGTVLFHRSFLVPRRGVLMENTAFYAEPGFSATYRLAAFSLGETLDIEDHHDIWLQVAAGGREWWVPNWVVREL
ncbi:MAG: hypothetical protein RLZZ165_55 [Bacteroidota bacterium]